MRRLTPFDKALVLILVPLWIVWFGLSVRTQLRGGGLFSLGLSVEDADSYPVLSGQFAQVMHQSDPLAEAGLRAGDRLIQLGEADLRGVGSVGFAARALDEAGRRLTLPLVFERNGKRVETSVSLTPVSILLPMMAVSFAFAASALFLLLRGRPTPTVRAYFYFAMCQAIIPGASPGSGAELYAWFGMFVVTNSLYHPLMIHLALVFPDDRSPEGWWHRIWPWFFGIPFGLCTFLFWLFRLSGGFLTERREA